MLYSRRAVETVGGFDNNFQVKEDADLLWRLTKAGYLVIYNREIFLTHLEPAERLTFRGFVKREFSVGYWWHMIFYKHPRKVKLMGWPFTMASLILLTVLLLLGANLVLVLLLLALGFVARLLLVRDRIRFTLGTFEGKRRRVVALGLFLVLVTADVLSSDIGRTVGMVHKLRGKESKEIR